LTLMALAGAVRQEMRCSNSREILQLQIIQPPVI
jgi:hypothetical protein